jgi:hypothetical protein
MENGTTEDPASVGMSLAEARRASMHGTRPRPVPFGWQIATLDTAAAATGHRIVSTVRPAHKVCLIRYFIDTHEITIEEINPYVRATDEIDGIACRTMDSALLSISHEELRTTAF